jgi:heme/copper-type cytochrome/quinol oxidase subunit 2
MPTTLSDAVLLIAAAIFVMVAAFMGWRIVRDRKHGDGGESLGLQLLWWALPTFLMLLLFGLTIVRARG